MHGWPTTHPECEVFLWIRRAFCRCFDVLLMLEVAIVWNDVSSKESEGIEACSESGAAHLSPRTT